MSDQSPSGRARPDPIKAVPSWASIVSAILPAARRERDLHRLGREVSEHLRVGVANGIATRNRVGDDRFLDVHHRQLLLDPMGSVRRIYAFLGLELLPPVERAITDWQDSNRSGAHGSHRYAAEQFGLSTGQLRADYDFYTRHYDIELEA